MKFIRAHFSNFRILRDVEIRFSTDSDKKLTVIRAENATGKTTVMSALQWVLFGDDALPEKSAFRLHPIDWDFKKVPRCLVKCELEFEHTTQRRNSEGGIQRDTERYIATRTTTEESDGRQVSRRQTTLVLHKLVSPDVGFRPLENPKVHLANIISLELKDLFFTDSDRALTYISAEVSDSDKRKKVRLAIRTMLGMDLLEEAKKHVESAKRQFQNEVRAHANNRTDGSEMVRILNSKEQLERRKAEIGERLDSIKTEKLDIQDKIETTQAKLEDYLRKGNRDDLVEQRRRIVREIESKQREFGNLQKDWAASLSDESLCMTIVRNELDAASSLLNGMKAQGKIPKTHIPILRQRLEYGTCICGAPLNEGSPGHSYICQLIAEQESQSDIDNRVTELHVIANEKIRRIGNSSENWWERTSRLLGRTNAVKEEINDLQARLKETDRSIESIPEAPIAEAKEMLDHFRSERDRLIREQARLSAERDGIDRSFAEVEANYTRMLKDKIEYDAAVCREFAAGDLLTVLNDTAKEIESVEIPRVSTLMNDYFLSMIRADIRQNALIQRCEISRDFEIKVYGARDRLLNPDVDLNGAARRALTLAFILALTETSAVEAPNIIDTPLGMMDPQIKQSVVPVLVDHSNQVVLFLTRSEIRDCEQLLDKYAGEVVTLTNSDHFPKMLVNNPEREHIEVMKCECDHRHYCRICERIGDAEGGILVRRNSRSSGNA